jgi:hypothetical protein
MFIESNTTFVHLNNISIYIIVLIPVRFGASDAPLSGEISVCVTIQRTSQTVLHTLRCIALYLSELFGDKTGTTETEVTQVVVVMQCVQLCQWQGHTTGTRAVVRHCL